MSDRAPPVPPVSPEDLEHVPEPVSACPSCGFLGIRPASLGDGVWAGGGELTAQACPRCGFVGVPVLFSTRAEYAAFVRELAEDAFGKWGRG